MAACSHNTDNLSRKVKTILLKLEMMKRRDSENPGSRTFRRVALDIWEDAACSSSHRTLKMVIQTTRSKREHCTANWTARCRVQEEHSTASLLSAVGLCVVDLTFTDVSNVLIGAIPLCYII